MAVGVYSALHQAGLRVPHDLSVAGYDDIAIAAYLAPPLTTLRQFKVDLGSRAARMLLQILEARLEDDQWPEPQKVGLTGELVVRASTAAPQTT
jgi:LacI family transcriptional regulator